jgi:hypothetical protein
MFDKTEPMKKEILLLILLVPILIISCKKETFPDNEDLKGNWAAITTLMDQEILSFDGVETLFYANGPSRYIQIDTLIYKLDKKHEKLHLSPVDSPGTSESVHKILLNSENNELTIWDLHGPDSESKFKRQ